MQIIIKGRQVDITPRLNDLVEHKVERLSRLLDGEDTRIEVTILEENTRNHNDHYGVQLAVIPFTPVIRSEARGSTITAALDAVLAKVTTQLSRHKDRQTRTIRKHTPGVKVLTLSRTGDLAALDESETELEEASTSFSPQMEEDQNEQIWSQIQEIRQVPSKPMNDKEAIAQMDLLGASFYPFFNEATNTVNVIYRLDQGGYGLLVPSLE